MPNTLLDRCLFFFLGVSERIKETSIQMLKPKPGKCIEDSLQEVKVLLCKNTNTNINE